MERQYLKDVFEDLETFIVLKHQNHLIMAWIQLKKNMKLGNLYAKNRGRHDSFRSNPNHTISYNTNQLRIEDYGKSETSEYPRGHNHSDRYIT